MNVALTNVYDELSGAIMAFASRQEGIRRELSPTNVRAEL